MKISVGVGSFADKYCKQGNYDVELPNKSTITDAIRAIGLPNDIVGIAIVNGIAVRKDFILNDKDVIILHPPIVGG